MTKTERILKILSGLCEQNGAMGATINYSVYSGQFYLSLPCEIKEGICLRSICEHRDSIEAAATAAIEAIKDKHLVFNAYGKNRREVYFCLLGEI